MLSANIRKDIWAVSQISAVPSILKVVAELTGMRVTMVARVTPESWTACAAYDRMGFGLEVGSQLDVTTTLCKEVCDANKTIVIEHASIDPVYQHHSTPKLYKIESYIAIPILRSDGRMFGTLCAIDHLPAKLDTKVISSLTLFTELISHQLQSEEAFGEATIRAGELELKVAERTARLQEMVSELESYSYSISHDLRAPLRAMQSFARILMEECGDRLDDVGKDYVRRIIVSADRMDRLIQDLLIFSRAGKAGVALEKIDLQALVEGILESYPQFDSPKSNIRVTTPLPPVLGAPAALTICISNLLDNAIKFLSPARHPDISISAEAIDDRVRIFFKDNGIGIAADQWEKIFGIFYRLDSSSEGTGIGLSIVKKAIEGMGGMVGLSSQEGAGSTFYLELAKADSK